ncbi:MAG: flippase, partial [candidate division WOR-3 bacterium]|nr:flippase [candidate division WOR-3 bacterium]
MRALKNFFIFLLSEGTSYVFNFLTTVYLARVLKVTDFGKINFAYAFFAFGSIFANFGLLSIGTRDIAQLSVSESKKNQAQYIINFLSLRFLIATVVFGILWIIATLIVHEIRVKTLIVLYSLTLFPTALSLEWVFLGWEKAGYIMISKIITAVSYFLLALAFIKGPTEINQIPLFFFLSNLLGTIFLLISYLGNSTLTDIKFELDVWLKRWWHLIKNALPFGLGTLFIQFSLNFNVIFLGLIKTSTEVGFYSASFKILSFLLIFDRVVNNTTFPIISRYTQFSKDKLLSLINKINKLIFVIALPISVITFILHQDLIVFVYGKNYLKSAQLIQVLIWFLLITMLNSIFTTTVIAQNRQQIYISVVSKGFVANLISNAIFVPLLGALGTAIALVLQELVIFIFFHVKTKLIVSPKIYWQNLSKPLTATLVTAIFTLILKNKLGF